MLEYKIQENGRKEYSKYTNDIECNIDNVAMLLNAATLECYSQKELEKYKSLVLKLTYSCTPYGSLVTVNNTNREEWETNNPNCVSREVWERIALKICKKYSIDLNVITKDQMCDVALEIKQKTISCEVINSLSIIKQLCDLNINVNATDSKCIAEYNILIENNPSCNLSLSNYKFLLSKSYNYDTISTLYSNNLMIKIINNVPHLHTQLNTYNLTDNLIFTKTVSTDTCKLNIAELLRNYDISDTIKQQLLNN